MAEYVELYMDQGSDFSATINLNDDDTNLAVNIDSYIITSQLRKSMISANSVDRFTCTVVDALNGDFTITMPSANTSNLKPGTYFFDVKVTANNSTSRLIEGIIFVTPAITK